MATITSIINKLDRMKKSQLVTLLARAIYLLGHKAPEHITTYGQGWDDSRQTIIELLELEKYYEH